ncbi:DUF1499 domain-containing protein [Marinobacterium aestuariivivens]|uniref:DUF1499 domain-containing protein n=1 Tax=Marinobacterium aestuariivivens TaxID=1698799 RepID=A0ABW2A2Z9_9GAMM
MSILRSGSRITGGRWPARLSWLALLLLIVAALLMAGAGPGYRLEWLGLGAAFGVLRYGVYVAIGAGAMGMLALLAAGLNRRAGPALAAGLVVVSALALLAVPWQLWQRAQQVPPIHDITTDTGNPPAFVALAAAREAAPNAVDYPGTGTARQQIEAYPDIRPLVLDLPLDLVRNAVETTALDQGWEIVAITDHGLEATATTLWFGFKDDVVIRLSETDGGTRVDMRSASRLGRSDLGTNAGRIRTFLEALTQRVAATQ